MNGTWDKGDRHTFEGITPMHFGDMVRGSIAKRSDNTYQWFLHGITPNDHYLVVSEVGTQDEEETRDLCVAAVESRLLRGDLRRRE